MTTALITGASSAVVEQAQQFCEIERGFRLEQTAR
jgi:hypothetical protein